MKVLVHQNPSQQAEIRLTVKAQNGLDQIRERNQYLALLLTIIMVLTLCHLNLVFVNSRKLPCRQEKVIEDHKD
jgi:hypothetical protein